MDSEWVVEQLDEFIRIANSFKQITRANHGPIHESLLEREPRIRAILNAVAPALGTYTKQGRDYSTYWEEPRVRAIQARAIVVEGTETQERLGSTAPRVAADSFHPWVWEAARPLWEAGSRQDAVAAAGRSVNARLQSKAGRRDLSETKLVQDAFSLEPPKPAAPTRLRLPGDRSTDTWRSRQEGALSFGVGCFKALRNPAAHEHELDLEEQVALEQLAALSLLARWIDEAELEQLGDA